MSSVICDYFEICLLPERFLNILGAFQYVKNIRMSVILWFSQYTAKSVFQGHYVLSMIQCDVKTYLLSCGL